MDDYEQIQNDHRAFFLKLRTEFPDLFYKDDCGELYVPCGCYCPKGWETLVYDLLRSINNHVTHSNTSEKINVRFFQVYKGIWIPIYNFIYRLVNPDKVPLKYRFIKYKVGNFRVIRNEELELQKTKFGYRIREKLKKLDTWIKGGRYEYKGVPIPPVKIDQIKEKFGGLRVYISGGDDYVRGAISFAEYLSQKTCRWTGGLGESYNKRSWIVTASKEKIEEFENEK
jgi:hypothetical protein